MSKYILILSLSIFFLSCGKKQKKKDKIEASSELKQEIDSLELVTKEIKSTEESIEVSIKKLDDMLNEIDN
ncbi:hypothetical protein ACKGJY_11635 [Hyunsoonleella sp. 2307UL5-6]|uniref:hypothetical protein n=1 Tax=Hyunsoonleella sp. 2307UL5-6 TaxID=3384768 RepID=UPI0039BC2765